MKDTYVIGLDAGATKSHLAIFDTSGSFKALRKWGPLNYEVLPGSFRQFEQELNQWIHEVLAEMKISKEQVVYGVFGIAGVDTERQYKKVHQIIQSILKIPIIVCNDAYLGVMAGAPDGEGICAVNGTGFVICGMDCEGKKLQIGGIGIRSDDKGGGGYIGLRAIQCAYSALFRMGQQTLMTGYVMERLDLREPCQFLNRLNELSGAQIASLNDIVFQAAQNQDAVALGILQDVAENYAGGINAMIHKMYFSDHFIRIILAGSVFLKGEHPHMVRFLKQRVTEENQDKRIVFEALEYPPVFGAVIWGLNKYSGKENFFTKVRNQMVKTLLMELEENV